MTRIQMKSCVFLFLVVVLPVASASTVQVLVGWNANFSFELNTTETNATIIVRDKTGLLIIGVSGTTVIFYSPRVDFTGNTYQKHMSFILKNVTLDDAGRYIAHINNVNAIAGEQMLIVKDSPSKPQIMELNIAESGSSNRLNCFTKSNSMPPNHGLVMIAEWKMNGIVITSGGRYIFSGTELTISNLTYMQDNGTRFTCFAYEDQLAISVESDAHTIDVKYGPNIQLNQSSSIIREIEGRKIIMSCTADCNPPCSFQWRKELVSGSLTRNQSLIISTVGKVDAGRYTCTVNNTVTGRSGSVQTTIIVIYGPDIGQVVLSPSVSQLKVEENITMNINCSADCYPVCNYTWTGPQGFSQTDALLSQVLGRNKAGIYTCTATNQDNTGKTASANVTITVLYGPDIGQVVLSPSASQLKVEENITVNINCSADCYPVCNYTWTGPQGFSQTGALLSQVLGRNKTGIYTCTATNQENKGKTTSANVTITFFYAPEVLLQPAILPRPSLYIVKLGQTNVNLTCVVIDANPAVQQFIWTKDGQHIQEQTGQTLIIAIVTRDTIGKWGCKGVNSKSSSQESTLDLDVHYGPIMSNIPNIMKVEGETLNVTCIVDSRPPSSISWTKSQSTTFTQHGAELYIVHLNRSDKGTYECTANNTIQPTGQTVVERHTVKSSFSLDVTLPSTSESFGLPVAGIAAGISVGVVIFIAGICIFLWRRYQHTKLNGHDSDVQREPAESTRRNQINANSVKQDVASGKEHEGLHFTEAEASQYQELNGITLEENRNADVSSPESDSYETLHPYGNSDIQMYSSLKIHESSKDCEKYYENT